MNDINNGTTRILNNQTDFPLAQNIKKTNVTTNDDKWQQM